MKRNNSTLVWIGTFFEGLLVFGSCVGIFALLAVLF